METTDLHAHVMPYDYFTDRPAAAVGLARTAAHIEAIRAGAANTLLFDNGDFLQGNPMGDYVAYERGLGEGEVHPVIRAMNAVGFDAVTLGNHEFNYGLDFLLRALAGASFPIVCANLARTGAAPGEGESFCAPYVLLDREVVDGAGMRHAIRIGVIGFLPPQVMTWDRKHLDGRVVSGDIVETARHYVPRIKADGADIVIALNHSGIGEPAHVACQENASVPLAEVDGIDAVMTGHQHMLFPGPFFCGISGVDAEAGRLHGKPAVMGGFWGSHLGVIDLLLEQEKGRWRVVDHETALCPIARRNKDGSVTALVDSEPRVTAAVADAHAATLAYIRRPVGRSEGPIHSYFALVADNPVVQLVSNAQLWYLREMLRDSPWGTLPILSAAAPFKAGGLAGPDFYTDVPSGDLAIKHIADVYLYPNTVRAVRVTGAELRGWLERSACVFRQVLPGVQDQQLIDPAFPSYNFDVIEGVTYRIDISQPARFDARGRVANPAASRVLDLCYRGRPVTDDMEFVVATNNFRAGGGGHFPGATGESIVFVGPDTNRDVVVRYVAEHGAVDPAPDRNWSLASLAGTSVLFDTAPRAGAFIGMVPELDMEPAGAGPDGFARYRILL